MRAFHAQVPICHSRTMFHLKRCVVPCRGATVIHLPLLLHTILNALIFADPRCSMYGIFTYTWLKFMGKCR